MKWLNEAEFLLLFRNNSQIPRAELPIVRIRNKRSSTLLAKKKTVIKWALKDARFTVSLLELKDPSYADVEQILQSRRNPNHFLKSDPKIPLQIIDTKIN